MSKTTKIDSDCHYEKLGDTANELEDSFELNSTDKKVFQSIILALVAGA